MGFLNWLMKGVDVEEKEQAIDVAFEDENAQRVMESPQSTNRVGVSGVENNLDNLRNLSNLEKSSSINVSLPVNNGVTDYINATPPKQKSQIIVFKISGIRDLQNAIKHLASKQPAVLNMESLKKKEIIKIMDYLNGAVFGLNATVHKMQGKLYLVSPEGMEIALQEKKKDKRR